MKAQKYEESGVDVSHSILLMFKDFFTYGTDLLISCLSPGLCSLLQPHPNAHFPPVAECTSPLFHLIISPPSTHTATCIPASPTAASLSSCGDWSESVHAQFSQHCTDVQNDAHPADIMVPSRSGAGHTSSKRAVLWPHLLSSAFPRVSSVASTSGLIRPLGKLLTAVNDFILFALTVVIEGA